MCACHTNHGVGCIKERIKLHVRKSDGIYINQIIVRCSVEHLMAYYSYLTITDVTWYVHHKFPVSFLLYIATKKT